MIKIENLYLRRLFPVRLKYDFSNKAFLFPYRVGGDSGIQYLVLQVHYATVDQIPATGDDSGVFVHYTEKETKKTAGVILMGTGGRLNNLLFVI